MSKRVSGFSIAMLIGAAVLLALRLQAVGQTPLRIQIRVLNAKNGKRVGNQKVSVAIKGTKDATEYITDSEGNITVVLPHGSEVFAAPEWWTTCRELKSGVEPYVSALKVSEEGVTIPNSCGKATSETLKGTLDRATV